VKRPLMEIKYSLYSGGKAGAKQSDTGTLVDTGTSQALSTLVRLLARLAARDFVSDGRG
jgi:hypothetical protein